jgi:hypothetical protein
MTLDDVRFWQRDIQPTIVRIAESEIRENKPLTRADYRWPWIKIRLGLPMAQAFVGRRCQALTLNLPNTAGESVPSGLIFMIEDYPWPFPTPKRFRIFRRSPVRSTFTWFLTSAPKEALYNQGVAKTPSLLRILIDTALVTSVSLGLEGRMWLHAAPEGGDLLVGLYRDRCQLLTIEKGMAIPMLSVNMSGSTVSDGRHFYATPFLAMRLINELQETRHG